MSNIVADTLAAQSQGQIDSQRPRKAIVYDEVPTFEMSKGDVDVVRNMGGLKPSTYETLGHPDPDVRFYDKQQDRFAVAEALTRSPETVPDFLRNSFDQIHARQRAQNTPGGATANVVYISSDADHTVTVANTGDSRAVLLVREIATGKVTAQRLSKDHAVNDPQEQARIEAMGGQIGGERSNKVKQTNGNGLLSVARAFGDPDFLGVIHTPDITQIKLANTVNNPKYETYILNSCDGVYAHDRMHEDDLAGIMEQHLGRGHAGEKANTLAKKLANTALHRGSKDNITVNIVRLTSNQTKDVVIGTFDGHDKGGEKTAELAATLLQQHISNPNLVVALPPKVAADHSHDLDERETPPTQPTYMDPITPAMDLPVSTASNGSAKDAVAEQTIQKYLDAKLGAHNVIGVSTSTEIPHQRGYVFTVPLDFSRSKLATAGIANPQTLTRTPGEVFSFIRVPEDRLPRDLRESLAGSENSPKHLREQMVLKDLQENAGGDGSATLLGVRSHLDAKGEPVYVLTASKDFKRSYLHAAGVAQAESLQRRQNPALCFIEIPHAQLPSELKDQLATLGNGQSRPQLIQQQQSPHLPSQGQRDQQALWLTQLNDYASRHPPKPPTATPSVPNRGSGASAKANTPSPA